MLNLAGKVSEGLAMCFFMVRDGVLRSELVDAQEAFFCGTPWEITPIESIDGLSVGSGAVGPSTTRLRERLMALAHGHVADRPEWRTPVYRPVDEGQ